LSQKRLDHDTLVKAIAFAGRSDVISRATTLGNAMAGEDGVSVAVDVIEQLLSSR